MLGIGKAHCLCSWFLVILVLVQELYLFFQNHVLLRRGTFYFTTVEFFWANVEKDDKVLRLGPGLQYLPFQGLELRLDLYNSRVFSEKNFSNDSWSLAGQVHIWL